MRPPGWYHAFRLDGTPTVPRALGISFRFAIVTNMLARKGEGIAASSVRHGSRLPRKVRAAKISKRLARRRTVNWIGHQGVARLTQAQTAFEWRNTPGLAGLDGLARLASNGNAVPSRDSGGLDYRHRCNASHPAATPRAARPSLLDRHALAPARPLAACPLPYRPKAERAYPRARRPPADRTIIAPLQGSRPPCPAGRQGLESQSRAPPSGSRAGWHEVARDRITTWAVPVL